MEYSRRGYLRQSSITAIMGFAGVSLLSKRSAGEGDELPSILEDRVPTLLDRYDVPGAAIAVVTDGEVSWTGAYGDADRDTNRPMKPDTLCRPQSITKSLTAWGAMTLIEREQISLDTSIRECIPDAKLPDSDAWDEVTVRRLLSHTAGLPEGIYTNYAPGASIPSLEEAVRGNAGAAPARPEDPPGTTFQYSNPGYVLLELLIEEVTGQPYPAYMQTAVFEPLGMDTSTFDLDEALQSGLATSHERSGEVVEPYREAALAHGMLFATVEDIATFVAAGMPTVDGREPGRDVLTSERVAELHSEEVETTGFYGYASDGYGLGHLVETLPDGYRAVSHGGQGTGTWAWYHSVPETGDGIVILTNSERSLRLIAAILTEWTDSRGLGSVSLARTYSRVVTTGRVVAGGLGIVGLGLAWRLGRDSHSGRRTFAPLADHSRLKRGIAASVAVVSLVVWWMVAYPIADLFLPNLADWVGGSLSLFAVLLFLMAVFPKITEE
ncbi:CubicO group peptidase, beta-lactamase class C family [Halalkaliarchaeum desulfuricum]|uniref:CubicO group peptidase, beta-lactamase class C family n=1 Tax=Halalkaliarchaeum desulfuricum TaxID=2055893 RepID=A0A343TLA5_9EURY|nr:serine hydrolase domain-containing protein [Halalkaliarchaeum desulfuricum]AUX09877.1 CubicO group peptidase, beta-lactamase class C family [Halalkaliarchaeum desulfuricum]